jgi:hypothetical protein
LYEAKETEEESDASVRGQRPFSLHHSGLGGSHSGSGSELARQSDATSDCEDRRRSLYENVSDTMDVGEVSTKQKIYILYILVLLSTITARFFCKICEIS